MLLKIEIVVAMGALMTSLSFGHTLSVRINSGEGWWGCATAFGSRAPFGLNAKELSFDLRRDNYGNQTSPFLLSTDGRYVWSEKAFAGVLTNGILTLSGDAEIEVKTSGNTLRDAFLAASKEHFPASGKMPDISLFERPQWNTWIELTYNQNQSEILSYARAIAKNGFPVGGVIMIDDTWQHGYGEWDFDVRRFPRPKEMIDELHASGYKVMLWVCPFVSMDSSGYREMVFGTLDAGKKCPKGGLIMTGGENQYRHDIAKSVSWWNGVSASIDFTHPRGVNWFARGLRRLQSFYGIDGFKFDAGDVDEYVPPYMTYQRASPPELCEAYAKFGLQFPLNEYRACFRMGGQPIVHRLQDKGHNWRAVQQLVPEMISCGLLGHPFVCPDMIGGGSWMAFMPDAPTQFDSELFVRSAQVHALAPMMQFSAAPWRLLKDEYLNAVRTAAWIRMKWTSYILETAKDCAKTGEPMLRAMEYEFPGLGAARITDQFMLGRKLLVAPQVEKNTKVRRILIPPGTWMADDGDIIVGPKTILVETPLARLPHFALISKQP